MHFMIGLAIFVVLIACFPRIMLGIGAAGLIALLWLTAPRSSDLAGGGAVAPAPAWGKRPTAPTTDPPEAAPPSRPASAEPTARRRAAPRPAEPPRLAPPRLRLFIP